MKDNNDSIKSPSWYLIVCCSICRNKYVSVANKTIYIWCGFVITNFTNFTQLHIQFWSIYCSPKINEKNGSQIPKLIYSMKCEELEWIVSNCRLTNIRLLTSISISIDDSMLVISFKLEPDRWLLNWQIFVGGWKWPNGHATISSPRGHIPKWHPRPALVSLLLTLTDYLFMSTRTIINYWIIDLFNILLCYLLFVIIYY
jgi:hypothetical protein